MINALGQSYGYAPDGFEDQHDALRRVGCTTIGDDLDAILAGLQKGDVVVVPRMRCIASSLSELRYVIRVLIEKNATLMFVAQPIDVSRDLLALLDIFSEFETGPVDKTPAVKPSKGRDTGGRPALINASKIQELRAKGLGPSAIAAELKVSRTSVYRLMAEAK